MSDPIERLNEFRSDIAGGPMLPPEDVRRRGDRIRRRRHVAAAAASVAVVAAIAAPVIVLSNSSVGGGKDVEPAPAPGSSLTEANLMTDDDTVFDAQNDWQIAPRVATEGQGPECQKQTYAELGATVTLDRDWSLAALANTDATDSTHFLHQDIAQFATPGAAQDAYSEVVDWITTCEPDPPTDYTAETPVELDLPVEGEGTYVSATYRRDGSQGGESYNDVQTNTAIVVSGDRLSVVQHTMPDADYRWPNGGTETPVRLMMMPAAERLVSEGAAPATTAPAKPDPTDGSTSGTSTPTVLSEDNLVTGDRLPALPKDLRASAWEQLPPQSAPTLQCQGAWLRQLGATERLSREFESRSGNGEDYALGLVSVAVLEFGDQDAADDAYATAQGWLEDCPATHATLGEPRIEQAAGPVDIPTSPNVAGVDRAHQVRTTELPDDFCPDGCDASYFDVQTVAQIGTRLVFVSRAELAGPCPPGPGDPCTGAGAGLQPWLTRVDDTVQATVGAAIWDLH